MREQIMGLQQRINQAWSVRMENWKRNQSHYQSQLEMLNPQRTLERGYAVILSQENNEAYALRRPEELVTEKVFQIQLAEGGAEVGFSTVKINRQ
jgi:exodeoxyribonuclease VII large subunit